MVVLVNRAKMGTASTGTGTITLGSAESGYQTFADAGVTDGQVVRYVIEDGTDWEIGTGTYTASGTTLSRTVLESSNADAALNLSGSAVVYVSAAAEDIPPVLELYAENPVSYTAPTATGDDAVAIGDSATASAANSMAIGHTASASGLYSVALDRNASSTSSSAAAIGYDATASGTQSVALGNTSVASGTNALAGPNSTASGTNSFALGQSASASNFGGAAFGKGATTAVNNYNVAIGNSYTSGEDAFAAAIANNTSSYGATGANSVAIGQLSKATSTKSVAIGGYAQSTSSGSVAIGGQGGGSEPIASGSASIAIGIGVRADAAFSMALGSRAQVGGIRGKQAWTGYAISGNNDGASQSGKIVLAVNTTDATPAALTTYSTPNATNQVILPNNSAYAFHGTIVARQQASQGTASAAWKIEGLIRREGSAGTTTLVNSATTVLDNTPSWGMALSADTTNGGLKIEVTGAAATNIRWVATVHTSEVTY